MLQTKLACTKCLASEKKIKIDNLQSAPESTFSTDRDKSLTRHDFRPWFIRVLNLKPLAQLLHTQLACTKYPISSGTDRQTDGRTDGRTDRRTDKLNPISPRFHGGCHDFIILPFANRRDTQTGKEIEIKLIYRVILIILFPRSSMRMLSAS